MNSRIHLALPTDATLDKGRLLARRIYMKLQMLGTRQVRLYDGMLLTYPYPARRGYGTRGLLVGIYTLATRLEWIEEDVRAVLGDSAAL